MGIFNVPVSVGNRDTADQETVNAVVDTGSTFSMMPASLLNRLGIRPTESRRLRRANAQIAEYPTGMARFAIAGRDGEARVIFGPDNIYLLGATTLEDLSFIVDPINRDLIPDVALLMRNGGGDGVC